jgi:hypothetical protein
MSADLERASFYRQIYDPNSQPPPVPKKRRGLKKALMVGLSIGVAYLLWSLD